MDKLNMKTENITQENIEKIRALFPNAVTEIKKDGKVELAVDFDVLKQELSDSLIESGQERYQMTWPDKKKSVLLANSAISATLRPCREESVDFDTTQNLYIEGDNLDVLKLLRETYLGKVKMIYIDPPYNTGNDFVYEDDFKMESGVWSEKSGDYDEQGNRLFQNTESNGRFHTDWLNMIYPRLKVARDLLTDDGVIFISIDDNEQANLKKICDEVFGESNFVVEIINVTGASQNGEGVKIQKNTESCLVYAKNYDLCNPNKVDKADESLRNLNDSPTAFSTRPEMGYTIYYNPQTKEIKAVKDYDKTKIETNDEKQVYRDDVQLINSGYVPIRPGYRSGLLNRWRWGIETFNERIDEIVINQNQGKYSVYFKQKGYNPPKNILNYTVGTTEIKLLFEDKKVFDFPKSTKLLQYLISIGSDSDSIILDFFSGSATTAHAVMQLNAEDGGKRKFIMVQLPEKCDEKSEAYKAGYKNICEIGKERIRRAGRKIVEEQAHLLSSAKAGIFEQGSVFAQFTSSESAKKEQENIRKNLDIGFRVLKLDSSNMQDVFYNPAAMTQSLLDATIDNIKPDRTPMDLLFQVMLELGVQLSAKIEEKEICGKKYYVVNENEIIACFDNDLNNDVITAIAKQQPLYAVFKDKSFATDSVGINNEQLFKTYSPTTDVKVI